MNSSFPLEVPGIITFSLNSQQQPSALGEKAESEVDLLNWPVEMFDLYKSTPKP